MLIKFEDIKVGDEVIIPSNSNLKYLKVLKLGTKSHTCSFQKDIVESRTAIWSGGTYIVKKPLMCEADTSLHNAKFYLQNEGGYRDIWLVRRENND